LVKNHCKYVLLLLAVLAGIAYAGEEQAKETKFPSSYDPKVLKTVAGLARSDFADPVVTVLELDSAVGAAIGRSTVLVWLRLEVGNVGEVRDAKVMYCTEPGKGFEQKALEAVGTRGFSSLEGGREHQSRWLWHRVVFGSDIPVQVPDTSLSRPGDDFARVDEPPEMIFQESPVYPPDAKMAGITGVVWIKALVDKRGGVREALVQKSSGVKSLDKAALDAAWRNYYKPAILNGQPINLWVSYKVAFDLPK
jgi:TonB family protein